MSRSKKIMALFLSIVMVLGLLPASAFAANDTSAFSDVKTSAWYHEDVQYVSENGLMKGTGENLFSPDATTTRGMIVTILYRLEGEPSPTGACPFQDVASGKYYEKAITWAAENGIVSGFSADTFGPDQNITREQMATIIYRYSEYKGYDVSKQSNLSTFSDAGEVNDWAKTAMAWTNAEELITGTSSTTLSPKGNATRAQVAVILQRFCENVVAKADDKPEETPKSEFTVTFDLNYGTAGTYKTETVKSGEKVSRPSSPSRSGYSFGGWYEAKSGGKQFDFKTAITKDITLYAHWSAESNSGGGSSGGSGYVPPTTYTVTFYMNDGTDAVYTASSITSGNTVSRPTDPTRAGYTFGGWYTDAACTMSYSFDTPITRNLTLYAHWNLISGGETGSKEAVDSDKDGLLDKDEKVLGTNPLIPDTDGDGLSDYEEVILGTDPLAPDTFDSAKDSDSDGLTDFEEVQQYKTDPYALDTDSDGLNDYDEIHVYETDPLNPDTDGDGLSDGFEVAHGLNPTTLSTDGITSDGNIRIEQTIADEGISITLRDGKNLARPSISGYAVGELSNNVFLSSSSDTTLDDNRAVIGDVVCINGEDEYVAGLTLSFELDSYEGNLDDLVIVEFGEDGTFDLIDCTLAGNCLSGKLEGCGIYCVLDLNRFLRNLDIDLSAYWSSTPYLRSSEYTFDGSEDNQHLDLEIPEGQELSPNDVGSSIASVSEEYEIALLEELNEINATLMPSTVSGQADIVFVIDTTGSMSSTINNVVTNVTSFATTLSSNYNVNVNYALIDFKDLEEDGLDTTVVVKNGSSNWFSDVNSFIDKVRTLTADGGGDENECDIDALETARRLDFRSSASKFIILITDAPYKLANNYGITSMNEEIDLLVADGIITSVVTASSYINTYQPLYEATGGIYANISNSEFSSSLLALANMIGETTADGTWVILKHGYRYVRLTDELDQDGDDLSTTYELGDEVEIDLTHLIKALLLLHGVPMDEYVGKTSITVYNAKSDPTIADTDNDGILDNLDDAPWVKGKANGIIGNLYLVTCYDSSFSSGHSFFAYQSYVNDSIDFSGLVNGWHRTDATLGWTYANTTRDFAATSSYNITPDEYVCIGNGALGSGASSGASDGSLDGSAGDANGVNYNMETAKFLSAGRPTGIGVAFSYLANTYITEEITSATLEKLISYLSQDSVNYWSLTHNCAKVAADGWNYISDTTVSAYGLEGWHLVATPSALRDNLRKINGHAENWQMSLAFP